MSCVSKELQLVKGVHKEADDEETNEAADRVIHGIYAMLMSLLDSFKVAKIAGDDL